MEWGLEGEGGRVREKMQAARRSIPRVHDKARLNFGGCKYIQPSYEVVDPGAVGDASQKKHAPLLVLPLHLVVQTCTASPSSPIAMGCVKLVRIQIDYAYGRAKDHRLNCRAARDILAFSPIKSFQNLMKIRLALFDLVTRGY